jgi:hypothetical protein
MGPITTCARWVCVGYPQVKLVNQVFLAPGAGWIGEATARLVMTIIQRQALDGVVRPVLVAVVKDQVAIRQVAVICG